MSEKIFNKLLFVTVCFMGALFTILAVDRMESLEVGEDFRNQNSSIVLEMK